MYKFTHGQPVMLSRNEASLYDRARDPSLQLWPEFTLERSEGLRVT